MSKPDTTQVEALSYKPSADHVEYSAEAEPEKAHVAPSFNDIDDGFDPVMLKALRRRVDWRLIPIMSAMYAISLVDRVNLAIARAANDVHMDKELGTGADNDRYSIITLVFFVPYIIFEMPVSFLWLNR